MAVSSLQNFIHIPTSFISIPNSKNLNAAASFHTTINNSYLPPQLLSTKRRRRAASLCVQCHGGGFFSMDGNDSDNNEDPLETINKVYQSIQKKDVTELANVIADQRPDIVDSIPFLRTSLKMKKLASHIIKGLQENLVFSIHPTTKDGSMVGIKWKVGWDKPLMKFKEGITIHSQHSYVGKLFIGNFETLLDPLLQLMPIKMMKWNEEPKSKARRVASLCLGLFLLFVSLFSLQFSIR